LEYDLTKILLSAAVAAIALSPTPAAAQTVPAGPRLEGIVGYDRVHVAGTHEGGQFYGLGAGYDFPVRSNTSLGVDLEGALANTDYDLGGGTEIEAGRDLYAGARASFGLGDGVTAYLKAGYTNARVKVDGLGGTNLDGARVGAGLQYNLSNVAYIGAEYRYSNYQDDFARHQLGFIFGHRFGSAPVAAAPAPVVEAPAPAPAAPATQTCADGSVILATDACPVPPPPPPPPAVAPVRG